MWYVILVFNMNHWNQQVINTKHGRHLKIMSSGRMSTLMDLWNVIVLSNLIALNMFRSYWERLYEFQRTAFNLEDGAFAT